MSEEEYVVEKILEKRISRLGKVQYLVKWEGYKIEESTWEPEDNFANSKDLIKEFEQGNSKNAKPQNTAANEKDDYQILRNISDNIPKKIRSVKKIDEELFSLVEWEERSDGLMNDPAYIPSLILREINPKLLIEFYESKIKFVNKK